MIPIKYLTDPTDNPEVTPKNEEFQENLGSIQEEGFKGILGSTQEEEFQENLGSPGDRVMVSLPPGETPSFGWGGVNPDDIGVIVSTATDYFKGNTSCYRIDFPNHKYWLGLETELRRV